MWPLCVLSGFVRARAFGLPIKAASHVEKAFSGCESRAGKMNGAIYGRTGSAVSKQRRRRLVMPFEMIQLDRASSEPLHQQLYRQIREELESGSFDSSASRGNGLARAGETPPRLVLC